MSATRAILPRESGAYAELVFPLLSAFLGGSATPSGACFALAVIALFLVREPLAVLAGARGKRLATTLDAPARWGATVLGGVGLLVGVVGFILAGPGPRWWALVPALLAALVAPALVRGRAKSLGTEVLVAAALAAMVLPIGTAGRMAAGAAVGAAAVWAISFILATLAVHAVKARRKPELGMQWTVWAAPRLAAVVAAVAMIGAARGRWTVATGAAVLPSVGVVLAVAALRPHPRRLKRVGWSLVVADAVTLGLLVVGR